MRAELLWEVVRVIVAPSFYRCRRDGGREGILTQKNRSTQGTPQQSLDPEVTLDRTGIYPGSRSPSSAAFSRRLLREFVAQVLVRGAQLLARLAILCEGL